MIKKNLDNMDIATLNFSITRAFFIGYTFNCLISLIRQDGWIIPLISPIIWFIYIKLIIYIMNYKPELNLPQKLKALFKKKLGIVLIILTCILVSFLCVSNYLNISNFIQGQFLNKTPTLVISIVFIIAIFYALEKGINAIAKTNNILFYIGIILFVTSVLGLLPSIKLSNLMPSFQSSPTNIIKAINCYYAFNVAPMLLLTIIPKNKINNPKLNIVFLLSTIISTVTLFSIIFSTLSTFGIELTSLYKYPEFHVLKNVNLIGFSTRIESILIIQWIFDLFMFTTISIYFIADCIKEIVKIKHINILYLILCISLVIITNILTRYNIFLDSFMLKYANIPVSILTSTIVIVICLKIKQNK